jgi:hypothetical protein
LPPPHAPKNLRQTPGPRHLPFDFLNDGADIEQFFVGARVVNGNLCFVRRDKAGCRSVIKRFRPSSFISSVCYPQRHAASCMEAEGTGGQRHH